MKIALIQGNYFPWVGYFAVVNAVDKFLLYEDVQYTKNDYRNRNWVYRGVDPTDNAKVWLTVPVIHSNSGQRYLDTKVADRRWSRKHFGTIRQFLSKERNWNKFAPKFEQLFDELGDCEYLYEVNRHVLCFVLKSLGITTPVEYVSSVDMDGSASDRVASIVKSHGGTEYLSGSAAMGYIDEDDFSSKGISISWCDYPALIAQLGAGSPTPELFLKRPESVVRYLVSLGDKHE